MKNKILVLIVILTLILSGCSLQTYYSLEESKSRCETICNGNGYERTAGYNTLGDCSCFTGEEIDIGEGRVYLPCVDLYVSPRSASSCNYLNAKYG